ncbi:MAG: hypothetical protein HFH94_01530 [Lachnospiraceae bacterium]|nr:hypothetical protein [uncultured Acetatifactor sp.]MCI9218415.1 hypothetical protein [Lachnospiraceae bacterium]
MRRWGLCESVADGGRECPCNWIYDGYVVAVIRAGLTEGITRVAIASGRMESVVPEIEEK